MPPGSFCNVCGVRPLSVPYFHCTVCADYDLCDACEKINDMRVREGETPLHDPSHVTIKFRKPHGPLKIL